MKNNNHPNVCLKVENLRISVGKKTNETILFENFSYSFEAGKVYAIVGNSGVGKTTLVSYLNGLVKSKCGNIFILDNLSILSNQKRIRNYKKIRKEISLLFQNPQHQLFNSTVIKDVAFGPKHLFASKKDANELARINLKKMGIDESLFNESPFVLSNGQQKRVALAGVLAIEPSIFIFDEPTAGLDPEGVKLMINLISAIKSLNKTVILISHNTDFVLEASDEVILLHDKKILASGKPYDVFCSPVLACTHVKKPIIISLVEQLKNRNEMFKKVFDLHPTNEHQLFAILKPLLGSRGVK